MHNDSNTFWSAFRLCRYEPFGAAESRGNKVIKKTFSCKIRSVFRSSTCNSAIFQCLPLQSNLSFPLSLHLSILTPLASYITLCLSHCQSTPFTQITASCYHWTGKDNSSNQMIQAQIWKQWIKQRLVLLQVKKIQYLVEY